jgi:hypothetical protein
MSLYTLALFVHVSGAIGFFLGIGTWVLGLAALRRAQRVEQVRAIAALVALSEPVAVISILLLLAAGLYMALTVWGLQTGWIDVALGSFVLMAPVSAVVIEKRIHTITTIARETPDGPLSETLDARIHDPVLGTALSTQVALLFGIVFLMTNKPSLTSSILVMVVALVLGLASSLFFFRVAHTRAQGVVARTNRT